jgi:hypothetical protein
LAAWHIFLRPSQRKNKIRRADTIYFLRLSLGHGRHDIFSETAISLGHLVYISEVIAKKNKTRPRRAAIMHF